MAIHVTFWGARGSIPTPTTSNRVYGGNTSCVEVRAGDAVFICDAGSGIRELGKDIMTRDPRPKKLHLLITHTHWDHIQGFPYFEPAYDPENKIIVYGRYHGDDSRHRLLSGQMSSEYFPVSFGDLRAQIISDDLGDGEKKIQGVTIRCFNLNHPGGCSGYIFLSEGKKVVYATDNELEIQPGDTFPDTTNTGPLRQMPAELVKAVKDADLLILDAQFDDEQYARKKGWGHSSCFSATDLATEAGVKNLALFHHDPESTDRDVDNRIKACNERVAWHAAKLNVFGAREGVELRF